MPPFQLSFRHLCNLIQIADGDIDKALQALATGADSSEGSGAGESASAVALTQEQLPVLRRRAVCAKYWVEECAPSEFQFRLNQAGSEAAVELSAEERGAVRLLRDKVVANIETFLDDKACAAAIYDVANACGMDGKALFRAAYQALIGKDQGPRLANFLRSISKERLLSILASY
jgi:lysyl-tRNA synthetase class 1